MIQGYYFEKPMPGSDYEEMMRRRVSDKPAAGFSPEAASEVNPETATEAATAAVVEAESPAETSKG